MAFGLAGVAAMFGVVLGGAATDRWGADRTLVMGVSVVVVSMAVL